MAAYQPKGGGERSEMRLFKREHLSRCVLIVLTFINFTTMCIIRIYIYISHMYVYVYTYDASYNLVVLIAVLKYIHVLLCVYIYIFPESV